MLSNQPRREKLFFFATLIWKFRLMITTGWASREKRRKSRCLCRLHSLRKCSAFFVDFAIYLNWYWLSLKKNVWLANLGYLLIYCICPAHANSIIRLDKINLWIRCILTYTKVFLAIPSILILLEIPNIYV